MQIKKKYIYIALGLWALVTVTYFTLCKIASDQAMLIFNKTMSAQKVLKGSVTLGSIDADIWGRVEFQNLVWLDIDGQPIVHVPQGRFKVRHGILLPEVSVHLLLRNWNWTTLCLP